MTFLVGECRGAKEIRKARGFGWGRMFIDVYGKPWEGEPWGFDNGCYGLWKNGRAFDPDLYQRRLDRAAALDSRPLLAVLPDLVAEGLRSLEFSLDWLKRLRAVPFPWYLAVQDGMTAADVAPHLAQLAGLFLGGSTAFKGTAPMWSELAHTHGKRFHYGRCGTPRRLAHARRAGADSADSAFPFWCLVDGTRVLPGRSRNLERFIAHWLRGGDPQMELPL